MSVTDANATNDYNRLNMARKPTIDPSVKDRARQLRAKGLSRDRVIEALAEEGHTVSAGWVSAAWAEKPAAPAEPTWSAESDGAALATAVRALPEPTGPDLETALALGLLAAYETGVAFGAARLPEPGESATTADVLRYMTRLVHILEKQLETAKADADATTKIGRVLAAAGAIIAKNQPEVPPDPNDAPDVQAAMAEAAELLRTAVDRAVKRRGLAA